MLELNICIKSWTISESSIQSITVYSTQYISDSEITVLLSIFISLYWRLKKKKSDWMVESVQWFTTINTLQEVVGTTAYYIPSHPKSVDSNVWVLAKLMWAEVIFTTSRPRSWTPAQAPVFSLSVALFVNFWQDAEDPAKVS